MNKELEKYEHPTDYVVIPIAMRDRIMARLNKAESALAEARKALTVFFYVLMRDEIVPGRIESLVQERVERMRDAAVNYSNLPLSVYADELAGRVLAARAAGEEKGP